jgi:ADP-dependent NAD(P)H-hydrate dehydratase / NAD(P)H-hydrate epimerase
MIQRVIPLDSQQTQPWALHSVASTRALEAQAAAQLPEHTLMSRAGLAVAQLAMTVAPDAQTLWIACGPGNNGGDGLEAAVHLKQWGKQVHVTWLANPQTCPADSRMAWKLCEAAGIAIQAQPPESCDLVIDALLGIGAARSLEGQLLALVERINARSAPVLAIDLPSGLNADTGHIASETCIRATHTLALLTLKPGLFTAQGREQCGEIWFDDLQVNTSTAKADALLGYGSTRRRQPQHAAHKGSFGDVCVIGGDKGMTGAALIAAGAALRSGCGRVYVGLLDPCMSVSEVQPELMFRAIEALNLADSTVVCGCGGGQAVAKVLPRVLAQAKRLVLDADALNAIAQDSSLQTLLKHRSARGLPSVLTPHPLEAARLLGATTQEVQAKRVQHAQQLADQWGCVVVLKGSGTVIAAHGQTPIINPTGSARLATAGTGDLLAGMLGGSWARRQDVMKDTSALLSSAAQTVHAHGLLADTADIGLCTASDFLRCITPKFSDVFLR